MLKFTTPTSDFCKVITNFISIIKIDCPIFFYTEST